MTRPGESWWCGSCRLPVSSWWLFCPSCGRERFRGSLRPPDVPDPPAGDTPERPPDARTAPPGPQGAPPPPADPADQVAGQSDPADPPAGPPAGGPAGTAADARRTRQERLGAALVLAVISSAWARCQWHQ